MSETSPTVYKVGSSCNLWFIYITASKFTYLTYSLISYTTGTCSRLSKYQTQKVSGINGKQILSKVEFSEWYQSYRQETCHRLAAI